MTKSSKPFFDPPPKTAPCRAILDHWRGLRGTRLRPARGEIDPAMLARALQHAGIFEVRSPVLTVCQIAGTMFRKSLGFELTGRNVIHLYAPELHRAAGYRFFMMATHPCAATLELPLRFSSGERNLHEIVLLPLAPDGPDALPTLLVGVSALDSVYWKNEAILPQPKATPSFRFVDIGAGIPATSMPPDDFNAVG